MTVLAIVLAVLQFSLNRVLTPVAAIFVKKEHTPI